MTNFTKLAALVIGAVIVTTSFAQAGVVVSNGPILKIRPVASCALASGEFPNDLWITNSGAVVIKKGTQVQWNVPFANSKGTYVLTADLAPSKSVFLADVLPSTEAGHPCKAAIV